MDLLADLTDEDRRELLATARRRQFAAREIILHEGDPGDTFLLIKRGRVAVRTSTPMGDTVILVVLGPGDFFGELALLDDNTPRSATVAALEPTEVWSFQRETLHALRRTRPGVDLFVLRTLAADIRRLSVLLLEALYMPVDVRVLRRLADLERLYRTGTPPTSIPLTQVDLASLAGASRATVNRVLRQAQSVGLIRLGRGRIDVDDPAELSRRAR